MNDGEQEESIVGLFLLSSLRLPAPTPPRAHFFPRISSRHCGSLFAISLTLEDLNINQAKVRASKEFLIPRRRLPFDDVQSPMKGNYSRRADPPLVLRASHPLVKKWKVSSNDLFFPTTTSGKGKSLNHLFSDENSHGTFGRVMNEKRPF